MVIQVYVQVNVLYLKPPHMHVHVCLGVSAGGGHLS